MTTDMEMVYNVFIEVVLFPEEGVKRAFAECVHFVAPVLELPQGVDPTEDEWQEVVHWLLGALWKGKSPYPCPCISIGHARLCNRRSH